MTDIWKVGQSICQRWWCAYSGVTYGAKFVMAVCVFLLASIFFHQLSMFLATQKFKCFYYIKHMINWYYRGQLDNDCIRSNTDHKLHRQQNKTSPRFSFSSMVVHVLTALSGAAIILQTYPALLSNLRLYYPLIQIHNISDQSHEMPRHGHGATPTKLRYRCISNKTFT